jgi:hypothetical protein
MYVQYCRIDELKDWDLKLADELSAQPEDKKGNRYLCINNVKYRLKKNGYVERIDVFLCAHPEPGNPSIAEPHFEKHKAKLIGYDPKVQPKLKQFLEAVDC